MTPLFVKILVYFEHRCDALRYSAFNSPLPARSFEKDYNLAAGTSVAITHEFTNPSNGTITYSARPLSGFASPQHLNSNQPHQMPTIWRGSPVIIKNASRLRNYLCKLTNFSKIRCACLRTLLFRHCCKCRFISRPNRHAYKIAFIQGIRELFHPAYADASKGGRSSIDPAVYFKMLMIGFFENLCRASAPSSASDWETWYSQPA